MLTKLPRATLAEQAADALIDFITSSRLAPGDILPSESRLSAQLGVSRPIVREALKSLAGRGVIDVVNGRGAVIKPLNGQPLDHFFQRAVLIRPKSLVELMEVRKGLEVQSAALAAARRTSEQLARMRETVGALASAIQIPETFADLDVAFHLQIADASGNQMLYYLIDSIREALKDTILEGLRLSVREEQLQSAVTIHQVVLEQLEKGDVDGATHFMTVHFDNAIATFLEGHVSRETESEGRATTT